MPLGGGLAVGVFPLLTFAVAVVLLVSLQLLIARSAVGRAFRAASDDRETAALMGVDTGRLHALAMALSLAIVAVAGVFLGIRTTFTFSSGPDRLLFAFEAVIIGGLGSLWGTLAGGVILGIAQTVGARISPGWGVLTGHLVFLAVLLSGRPASSRRPDAWIERTRDAGAWSARPAPAVRARPSARLVVAGLVGLPGPGRPGACGHHRVHRAARPRPDLEPAGRLRGARLDRPASLRGARRLRADRAGRRSGREPVPGRAAGRSRRGRPRAADGGVVFRFRDAYFAVGTWAVAEVYRLLVANTGALGRGAGGR